MREVTLPSGATLKINAAPFAESKALYQAILTEMKGVPFSTKGDLASTLKDYLCSVSSSPRVEKCMLECFKRCTYNGGKGDLKIDADTFEPVEAREDYNVVCSEIIQENTAPFMKSLYAEFKRLVATIATIQS